MCEKYGIDDTTRFLVLYFDAQMDVLQISKVINRPITTVRYWEFKTKKGENIRKYTKGNGPNGKIIEEIESKIGQMDNKSLDGSAVARKSGQNMIHDEKEIMARVEFCKKMLSDEGEFVCRAFFAGELEIELFSTQKMGTGNLSSKKNKGKNVTENTKLTCWGAVSARGATSLEISTKGMDVKLFRQVIENNKEEMRKLYSDGDFYFVQNSQIAHRMNSNWTSPGQRWKIIKFPRRSPDLSVMESLWRAMKERVRSDAPTNENELKESLFRNWKILTQLDSLQALFEGLHRRCVECIERNGEKIEF